VEEGRILEVEDGRVLGVVRHLEHPLATVAGAQQEVLIALALEGARLRDDAEQLDGDSLRLGARERGRPRLQHVARFRVRARCHAMHLPAPVL
jgi:hypothetical protein